MSSNSSSSSSSSSIITRITYMITRVLPKLILYIFCVFDLTRFLVLLYACTLSHAFAIFAQVLCKLILYKFLRVRPRKLHLQALLWLTVLVSAVQPI